MNLPTRVRLGREIVRRWWMWRRHESLVLKGLVNNIVMDDEVFLRLYETLHREGRITLTFREQYNLFRFVGQAHALGSDIAEVGVYKGGSAKLICEAKGPARLHLFDTFEGMPDPDPAVDLFRKGDFGQTSLPEVQRYLGGYGNVLYYPGRFPESAAGLDAGQGFSLVHLDVDIYESTLSALGFFFPRLTSPGFILVHDFGSSRCAGVRLALRQFLESAPALSIPLWDTHCLVMGCGRQHPDLPSPSPHRPQASEDPKSAPGVDGIDDVIRRRAPHAAVPRPARTGQPRPEAAGGRPTPRCALPTSRRSCPRAWRS